MRLTICGIDPGKTGALVALRQNGIAAVLRMPLKPDGKSIDGRAIARWLVLEEVDVACVELIGARAHTNGAGKAIRNSGNEFRFAIGVGAIHGVLEAMGIPYQKVSPMRWKTAVLRGLGTDKEAAIKYVQLKMKGVDLTPGKIRKPNDGIADAACIAAYGRDHVNWRE